MTNDELAAYRAMPGVMDNRSLGNALRDKLPGILDALTRAEAHAERLAGALEPFAEGASHLHPSHPDDGVTLDGNLVRHWREAWQALSAYRGEMKDD